MDSALHGFNLVTAPALLSPQDAYWHACSNTPYEPTYAPLIMDPDTALSRLFALDEAKLRIQQSLASVQVITR